MIHDKCRNMQKYAEIYQNLLKVFVSNLVVFGRYGVYINVNLYK